MMKQGGNLIVGDVIVHSNGATTQIKSLRPDICALAFSGSPSQVVHSGDATDFVVRDDAWIEVEPVEPIGFDVGPP